MKGIWRWLWWNIWHPFEFNILCYTRDEKLDCLLKAGKKLNEELRELHLEVLVAINTERLRRRLERKYGKV